MRYLLSFLLTLATAASAQTDSRLAPAPPRLEPLPEIKAPPGVADDLDPGVTIRQRGNNKLEEYRRGGKVYMIKVTPGNGLPPYYLIDREGSGKFTPFDEEGKTLSGAQWVIFEF